MRHLDKNKVEVLIDEVFELYIKTPRRSLVRYVFPNTTEHLWKGGYLQELQSWGMWKIYDSEIDIDGENIILLQVDGRKLKEVKKYYPTHDIKKKLYEPYVFDDKVFKFVIVGNKIGSIDFHTSKGGNNDMFQLMKAFVFELERVGIKKDDWFSVQAKREDLRAYIKKEFKREAKFLSENWFKSTKHNLKNKIPNLYKGYIKIGDFSKTDQTYEFALKV